jgi:uncharacterized repeat protein (TIGR03943 family)
MITIWAGFFVWLLVSREVYRYIGPRTQWVVVFGAIVLTLAAVAHWFRRPHAERADGTAGLLVMLVPIVAVLVVPEPSLGSLAASRKLGGGPVVALRPQPVGDGGQISFAEIEYASESSEYAAAIGITDGYEVRLTGFVTDFDGTKVDFTLTRFSIFCCAADVVPHSVPVDAAHPYPNDVWLSVQGTLEYRDGRFVVVAESIEQVHEPEDPYIR